MEDQNIKINALLKAVRESGALVREAFLKGSITDLDIKSNKSDIVTNIDTDVEKIISNCIRQYFPNVEVFSEESSEVGNIPFQEDNIAIIDPLDGTSNFSLGIPYFSISILIKEPQHKLAIIYNPVTEVLVLNQDGDQKFFLREESLLTENLFTKKNDYSLSNLSFAVISGYSIPPQTTEPFLQHLYYSGVKRVMSNWSPAHDYLNLILRRFDCVISLSEEGFSEAAGLFLARSSKEHKVAQIQKEMQSGSFAITVSAHQRCISQVENLIERFSIL